MKKIYLAVLTAVMLFASICLAQPTPPIPGSPEITFEELLRGLATPSLPIIKGPKEPPTVMLEQRIDSDVATAFEGALEKLARSRPKEIRVLINSDGGEVGATFRISQLIERFPAQVICVVDVRAQSGAAAILQSCDRRLMTSRSFMMMHRPNVTCEDCDEDKLIEVASTMKIIGLQIAEQSCQKSKVKVPEWMTKTAQGAEWVLNPAEALKLGFIDAVIPKVIW